MNNISSSRTATPVSNPSDYITKEDRENLENGMRVPGSFQCGKCSARYHDTEAFRGHVEKCFNKYVYFTDHKIMIINEFKYLISSIKSFCILFSFKGSI